MNRKPAKSGSRRPRIRGRRQDVGITLLLFFALLLGLFFFKVVRDNLGQPERDVVWGATFSKKYAQELGLDWRKTYLAVLDDLGVRHLRLPVYWDEIEPEPDTYNFTDIDWQVEQAAQRGVQVILAIGRKVPRWPECHPPAWTGGMEEPLVRSRILRMLEEVVEHYADNLSIVAWQVENEPLFRFGLCPPPDRDFLKQEVAVVSALDDRPIVVTESGELSTWVSAASIADILGISTYRTVWSKYIGFFYWPVSPSFYARRGAAISSFVDRVIITELQAEPWSPGPITMMPLDQQLALMDEGRLLDNLAFARRVGFAEAYLWGVEWWYWLQAVGHPELWETGRQLFLTTQEVQE
ncbi:hypothetical protein AMJ57_04450 [Parcubacteria bacterium SG8_24]|nr:MAG: hypothetical protein AMJ57_04450 [Parcubacteria bacterium SG8_24]